MLKYCRICHRCHGRFLCLTGVHIGKFMQTGENEWCRKFLTFFYGRKTARCGPQQINLTKQGPLWEREFLKNKSLEKHKQEEESFYKYMTQWSKSSKQVHLWWDISPHVNKSFRKYIDVFISITTLLFVILLVCFILQVFYVFDWNAQNNPLTIQRQAFISLCWYYSVPEKMFLSGRLIVFVSRCHQKGTHSCQQCLTGCLGHCWERLLMFYILLTRLSSFSIGVTPALAQMKIKHVQMRYCI